ncbi:MAG TPA: zf-TFIIB domain-containing protein [Archangium sp.]|uniref:zf-TFIIB domain-containing protein n=1 Tax=Archangium sp. TaxID=1872627 RepID=UPI002EDB4023
MVSESKCPRCTQSLQAFSVQTPSGVGLELARCSHCGGCWGASGRIQHAFGPSAQHRLIGGMTTRTCVECRILMTPAMLPADISVEVCSACHGMFLDAGELTQLGVGEPSRSPARSGLPRPADTPRPAAPPPAQAVPAPRPPRSQRVPAPPRPPPPPIEDTEEATPPAAPAGTFECIECGQYKPLREGQALRDGLACRACMKARAGG